MACSKPLTQEDIDKVAFFLEVLARELREGTARLLEYIPESRPADIRPYAPGFEHLEISYQKVIS